MKKISSGATVFNKKIFPLIWFGFIAFVVVSALRGGAVEEGKGLMLVMPIFVGVIGFLITRKLTGDLADEVHDGGNYLLIRRGSEEDRVPLSNIMNVSASANVNPPRVTLRLLKPGKFGSEVAFTPVGRMSLFSRKNPIVEDLIERAYKARQA